jgi:hypothetical protein
MYNNLSTSLPNSAEIIRLNPNFLNFLFNNHALTNQLNLEYLSKYTYNCENILSIPELQVATIISVNAVELTNNEITMLKESCDTFIYHRENLGGDININLGYLRALSDGADFYWVLSANDALIGTGIKHIFRALIDLDSDLLIVGDENSRLTGDLNNVFFGDGSLLPIGLISSVIYKTEKLHLIKSLTR